jgi:DNA-binding transcriptional LysR family regulator
MMTWGSDCSRISGPLLERSSSDHDGKSRVESQSLEPNSWGRREARRAALPQNMIAVRFGGDVRFLAVASPTYLSCHEPPETPDELKDHRCIRSRLASGKLYRWEFEKHGQEVTVDVPGALTLDHIELMTEAAAGGLGIAWDRLCAGALGTPLFARWTPRYGAIRLVPADTGSVPLYYGHRHVPAGLRAFIDVLKSTC